MTTDTIFDYLFETGKADLDEQSSVNLDRILLRVMTSPALVSHLENVRLSTEDASTHVVELLFRRFPPEYIDTVKKLIAIKSECYEFKKNGHPYLGFKVLLNKDDFNPQSEPSGY